MTRDYALIQRELLIGIRGKRSQNQLNRKLNTASNQIYRWETGKTQIPWDEFVQLCTISRLPIEAAVRGAFDYTSNDLDSAALVSHFRKINNGTPKIRASKASLSRWTTGKRIPTLQMILKWADSLEFPLSDFTSTLLGSGNIPCLMSEENRLSKIRALYHQHPWMGFLWRLLETHEYNRLEKHSDHFLLKHLPVPPEKLKSILQELEKLGAVQKENGRLRCALKRFNVKGSFEDQMSIRSYWLKQSMDHLSKMKSPSPTEVWGYKIYSIDEAQVLQVRDAAIRFYHEIDSILGRPKKSDSSKAETENGIYLMNTQIFPLYEPDRR